MSFLQILILDDDIFEVLPLVKLVVIKLLEVDLWLSYAADAPRCDCRILTDGIWNVDGPDSLKSKRQLEFVHFANPFRYFHGFTDVVGVVEGLVGQDCLNQKNY